MKTEQFTIIVDYSGKVTREQLNNALRDSILQGSKPDIEQDILESLPRLRAVEIVDVT